MYQLAILGAGQLGSRHLQALCRLREPCAISVVDPSAASLDAARKRSAEVDRSAKVSEIAFHDSILALPRAVDYAIIATNADVRLQVLRSLLEHCRVSSLVLEKVLFQRVGDYELAGRMLREHHVRAWVDCARRAYRIYAQVREFFRGDEVRYFQARGGDWGLGCNAVHFLDLAEMVAGSAPDALIPGGLDRAPLPSKRPGFMEFTGVLRGGLGELGELELASVRGSSARLLLSIGSETRACLVDEAAGLAYFLDAGGWREERFMIPFLSELGTDLAEGILTRGECPLPSYDSAARHHLPLIAALAAHAHEHYGTPAGVSPIT